ncbi:unnamed protein product [Calypogeia fissa]
MGLDECLDVTETLVYTMLAGLDALINVVAFIQGEAIAFNLGEMFGLSVPIIATVIGEGGSGGALVVGCCDKMLKNACPSHELVWWLHVPVGWLEEFQGEHVLIPAMHCLRARLRGAVVSPESQPVYSLRKAEVEKSVWSSQEVATTTVFPHTNGSAMHINGSSVVMNGSSVVANGKKKDVARNVGSKRCLWFEEELEEDLHWVFSVSKILHTGVSEFQDIALVESGPFGKVGHFLA